MADGAEAISLEAERYLCYLPMDDRSLPLVQGWSQDGLVVAEPGSSRRLIPVSELNDAEVFRSNMPAGAVSSSTFASDLLGRGDATTFVSASVPASLLVAGTNVLAVNCDVGCAKS